MAPESEERKKRRVQDMIRILETEFPDPDTELEYSNPLELLVATILSAQSTDKTINKITPALFKKYKSAEDYARAPIEQLEQDIRSSGFYHNKARNIKAACRIIADKYRGRVPDTMDGLIELPGVARKTANIVLSSGYDVIEGIAVDTHVTRLSCLLGLTNEKDPVKIERDLMKIVPKEKWRDFSYMLVLLGRRICIANRPRHDRCPLNKLCPSAGI